MIRPLSALFAAALVLAAAPAPAAAASSEINYRMTMPAMETCHKAMLVLLQRTKTDPKIKAEQQSEDEGPESASLEQLTAFMLKKAPASSALLTQNGCAPSEYMKIAMAGVEASMAEAVIEGKGKVDEVPAVAKENVTFLKQNAKRLQAMQAELAAAETAAGLDR
jgi:hypothetical protein